MKSTFFIVALAIFATRSGHGQDGLKQETGNYHFRWSARKAQQLDNQATLKRSTEVAPADKKVLVDTIAAEILRSKAQFEIASEKELYQLAENTRIKLVDLNNDDVAEILAQANDYKAGCGATGNCAFWIFRKSSSGYDKLLDTRDKYGIGGVEVFRITDARTNGFSDLILGAHDSASEQKLRVYRYRGGRYSVAECYLANWVSTAGDEWHVLKNPRISRCSED